MRKLACIALAILVVTGSASAQAVTSGTRIPGAPDTERRLTPADVERSAAAWAKRQARTKAPAPVQTRTKPHPAVRVLIIAGGAFVGMYAGAYLGATIQEGISPCHCDDPGLLGALVGIPVGAVAGGIVATILTR